MKSRQLSWKAVRRGDVYCAPACGGDCTWKSYQDAIASAKALCKRYGTVSECGALGMSLRDYFAAKAMAALIMFKIPEGMNEARCAKVAYAYADAMLKQVGK